MFDRSRVEQLAEPFVAENERFALFLVSTTVTAVAVGYAVGSVLAGESPVSQAWLVVLVGMWLTTMVTLFAEG